MYDTRDVTENRQDDVDEKVCVTAALEEDAKRWEEDGEDDFTNITVKHKSAMRRLSTRTSEYHGSLHDRCLTGELLRRRYENPVRRKKRERKEQSGCSPCGKRHFDRIWSVVKA